MFNSMSFLCLFKIDVTFKIFIRSKFNGNFIYIYILLKLSIFILLGREMIFMVGKKIKN
jgi:hypothetical protein